MTASRPLDPFASHRPGPDPDDDLVAIRAATLADAEALRTFKRHVLAETEFLLQGLEDFDDRIEAERDIVARFQQQPNCLLLVAVEARTGTSALPRAGLDGRQPRTFRPLRAGPDAGRDGLQIVGLASVVGGHLYRTRHVGTLSVAVLQRCWRRGIARRLMGAAVEWARAGGELHKLNLQVHASNAAAWALYHRLGFVDEGRLSGEARVGDRYDDLVPMGLWLRAPPGDGRHGET